MLTIDCLDQPKIFILSDGSIFKATSFKSKRHFMTEFFLITKIDKAKNCLTLMLLRPCSVCCDENVFIPMDEFITIDMSCLCGYQSIPNTCMRRCDHPPSVINDCICGPFTLLPENDEMVLWQSNVKGDQCGSIKLSIHKGENIPLILKIYFSNQKDYKTYPLIDEESCVFTISDCSKIKLLRPETDTKVQGIYEIRMKSLIEH